MKFKIVISLCISVFLFSLSSKAQDKEVINKEADDVAFNLIEQVPIFPGCKGDNNKLLKYCLNYSVRKFISVNFNIRKLRNLGLKGKQKVYVKFKILKTGKVEILDVRAPHKKIEKEAKRVVGNLPKMIPGKQEGKPVNVLYMVPIMFSL